MAKDDIKRKILIKNRNEIKKQKGIKNLNLKQLDNLKINQVKKDASSKSGDVRVFPIFLINFI